MSKVTGAGSKYGKAADAFLENLYGSVGGAKQPSEKLAVLQMKLGDRFKFYAVGGTVNEEMQVAALEQELLEQEGLIKSVLA